MADIIWKEKVHLWVYGFRGLTGTLSKGETLFFNFKSPESRIDCLWFSVLKSTELYAKNISSPFRK